MTYQEPQYQTLKEMAEELGLEKSSLRRYVLNHGFHFLRVRDEGNQLALALSTNDAKRVKECRRLEGFGRPKTPVTPEDMKKAKDGTKIKII